MAFWPAQNKSAEMRTARTLCFSVWIYYGLGHMAALAEVILSQSISRLIAKASVMQLYDAGWNGVPASRQGIAVHARVNTTASAPAYLRFIIRELCVILFFIGLPNYLSHRPARLSQPTSRHQRLKFVFLFLRH